MEAECNIVYRENRGGGALEQNEDRLTVVVREWHSTVTDYVITVSVRTMATSSVRKEIVDGDLSQAVRRGIAIFDEELANHPTLGEHD